MNFKRGKSAFLGSLAGAFSSVFGGKTKEPSAEDLKRADYNTSTKRLNVRFTEKIRNVFRFKWIKKA